LGGAGNFLRFKGGSGRSTKVHREKATDPEELQGFPSVTPKVVSGAEAVEGAHARFAKRGWALRSAFESGGVGLEEFTIYGLLGSGSSRQGMPFGNIKVVIFDELLDGQFGLQHRSFSSCLAHRVVS